MNNNNALTLRAYEDCCAAYLSKLPPQMPDGVKNWLNAALGGLDMRAKVLEIGCGPGRDADYVESLGYQVIRTDAAAAFIDHMKSRGHAARRCDVLQDALPVRDAGLIYANAVLLHLNASEAETALKKIHAALGPDGRVAVSLREGEGEEWSGKTLSAPRYFRYWRAADLRALLEKTGFDQVKIIPDNGWLMVVARRA